jgi:hypothetical protein
LELGRIITKNSNYILGGIAHLKYSILINLTVLLIEYFTMNDNIRIFGFQVSKIGEMETDIQDAVKWSEDNLSIAIADGASTSVEPKKWADLLVDSFCRDSNALWNGDSGWREWLYPIQQEWQKYRLEIVQNAQTPWFERTIRSHDVGSATFLGLQFDPDKKTYRAIAIGDCCLFHFHIEGDNNIRIIKKFPIEISTEFKTVTHCFNSTNKYNNYSPCTLPFFQYKDGDIFLLATDALADYIMSSLEEDEIKWQKLLFNDIEPNQENFKKITDNIRYKSGIKLKNDDTTLCLIYLQRIPLPVASQVTPKKLKPSENSRTNNSDPESSYSEYTSLFQIIAGIILLTLLIGSILFVLNRKNREDTGTKPQSSPSPSIVASSKTIEGVVLIKEIQRSEAWVLVPRTPNEDVKIDVEGQKISILQSRTIIGIYSDSNTSKITHNLIGYLKKGSYSYTKLEVANGISEAQWLKIPLKKP